ncbi:MAG: AAA family ATPase [Nocardioidaceae bacterium]
MKKLQLLSLLPLVERQSEQLTGAAVTPAGIVPLTMLLDEPEIHLHPLLQLQVLQYLRDLASEGTAQFILSTHSTTLLDALDDDELYLLSPASLSPDNQLNRLTTSQERLEVAREITGSTHLLTRAKPIVFVEGEEERPGVSSDVRVMTNLLPSTRSWALVPGRSKREVISSVGRLRQEGLELPGTPVFGLVDADRDGPSAAEHVVVWPVAMVENLLLDAVAIFAALSAFGAQTAAVSVEAVQRVLDAAAANRVDDEVRLRVQRQLPIGRLSDPS